MRKYILAVLGLLLGVGASFLPLGADLPTNLKWVVSYETLAFNTADGTLHDGQFAADEHDNGYYIKLEGQIMTHVPRGGGYYPTDTGLPYDIDTMEERSISGKAYYNVFSGTGGTVLEKIDAETYDKVFRSQLKPTKTQFNPLTDTNVAEAAIAYDGVANSGVKAAASSFTFDHTVTSNTNGILVFVLASRDATEADVQVSSVTYNGAALTQIREDRLSPISFFNTEAWYRLVPDTGTNQISVTMGGTCDHIGAYTISLTGVNQSSPIDDDTGHGGNSTPASTFTTYVTTTVSNTWIVDVFYSGSTFADPSSADQTSIAELAVNGGGDTSAAGYRGPVPEIGATSTTWDHDGLENYNHTVIAITPYVDAGGGGAVGGLHNITTIGNTEIKIGPNSSLIIK